MALYDLDNDFDLIKFEEQYHRLRERGGWVELKAKHPSRSLSQNKYLHLLLGYFASYFGCSLDEVKVDIFKRTCNADMFNTTRKDNRGIERVVLRSSASLTTDEMTTAITRFRNFSASEGLYLPEPNEKGYIMYAEQQVEKYKEFL